MRKSGKIKRLSRRPDGQRCRHITIAAKTHARLIQVFATKGRGLVDADAIECVMAVGAVVRTVSAWAAEWRRGTLIKERYAISLLTR